MISRTVGMNLIDRLDGYSSIFFDRRNPSNLSLQVRGLSTLTSSISQPLIILDHFPYEGDIGNINPNDIASVTILKDAAAASIWGAKAGNGVIVITTKQAGLNRPFTVDGNINYSLSFKPDLFLLPVVPASDAVDLEVDLFNKGAFDAYINNNTSMPPLTPVMEALHNHQMGLITDGELETALAKFKQIDVRDDFSRYIYRKQSHQQYQVSASAGNEYLASRISIGLDRDNMTLMGNRADRLTLLQNHTLKWNDRLTLNASMTYQYHYNAENSPGGYGDANYFMGNSLSGGTRRELPVYSRLADENGTPLSIDKYRVSYTIVS